MKKDKITEELRALRLLIIQNAKPMLTTEEAAKYMGYESRTMREMAAKGDIPHYKDPNGRIIRFRRDDLDAWMGYVRIDSKEEMEAKVARRIIGYKRA